MADAQLKKKGYVWAVAAGINAALAAISAKFFSALVITYSSFLSFGIFTTNYILII